MRKSNARKTEIKHLQEALARAQKAVTDANKNTNKVRDGHQKELAARDEQNTKLRDEVAVLRGAVAPQAG